LNSYCDFGGLLFQIAQLGTFSDAEPWWRLAARVGGLFILDIWNFIPIFNDAL